MKKALFYSLFILVLTGFMYAQQRTAIGTELIDKYQIPIGTEATDTLDYIVPPGTIYIATIGGVPSGYVNGTNGYGDIGKYQRFDFASSTVFASSFFMYFGAKEIIGSPDTINFVIRAVDTNGAPGDLLFSTSRLTSDIDTTGPTSITLNKSIADPKRPLENGISVFAGIEWGLNVDDQFTLISNTDPNGASPSRVWEKWDNGTYHQYGSATSWTLQIDLWVGMVYTEALAGPYWIPQGTNIRGFADLAEAIDAVNANGLGGEAIFYIDDDLDHTTLLPILERDDLTEINNLIIQPSDGVTPVVKFTGTHGLAINNTSYVTIDGDNGSGGIMTFQMDDAAGSGNGVISITEDCQDITVKNLSVQYLNATAASTGIRIRQAYSGTGTLTPPRDILIDNCIIGTNGTAFNDGIALFGGATRLLDNITISNSIITAGRRAITTFYVNDNNYFDNTIYVTGQRAAQAWYAGIYFISAGTNNIYNNRILELGVNGTGGYAAGILLNGSSDTVNIFNNFIAANLTNAGTGTNNKVYGIAINFDGAGNPVTVIHNSILLPDNDQTGRHAGFGWEATNATLTPINLVNNIIVNQKNIAESYGIHWPFANFGTGVSDYNNIYLPGSSANVGFWDAAATPTLANWQTASGQDANSQSKEVFFVSNTDLHLTGTSNGDFDLAGTPIAEITTDIDGDLRDILFPYMGADEADIPLGVITIAEAREDLNGDLIPDRLGQTVTIQGVVISPNYQTVNHSYYIWDGTAGITEILFGTTNPVLNLGDLVRITGEIGQFRGLTQIQPAASSDITFLSAGNPVPGPVVLSIADYMADPEAYEGTLVGFISVNKVSGTWPSPGGSATLKVTDGTDTVDVRIDSDTDLDDNPEPVWPVDLIGLGSQFSSGAAVLNDGYQILPRYYATDILPPGTIPVELTSFTASVVNGNVSLSWSTATEVNNHGFEIQRSSVGQFYTIGFIQGSGTTTQGQSYSYVDKNLAPGIYSYRLKQLDFDGRFTYSNVIEVDASVPMVFELAQNYPNPFNPATVIEYSIASPVNVTLTVYTILGEQVAVLVNNQFTEAGKYSVNFNASSLASGTYIYRLQAGEFVSVKKMLLAK
jgi:DNA/RNA endonuclease YhcR with UshA esterase domain